MDRFQAMQVFTRVVDTKSFTMAAQLLDLPRTTITTTIQGLERSLGTRLLNRTTRRVSVTPDGAAYYERCVNILADVEDADSLFGDASGGPKGRLRIDVPPSIGRLILIPSLCEFHSRYPDVELAIGMGDRPVDMAREGVDCAIRVGHLQDSSMIARRIGTFQSVTCAAPSYLERHGLPHTLEDLAQHFAVNYFSSRTGQVIDWDFLIDGESVDVKMRGCISVNDGDAYLACGLKGFGLIQPPRFMAQPYLESGELIEVLPQLIPSPMPISAVYLQNRHLAPKVRAFVDWAAELFSRCPRLSGCAADTICPHVASSAKLNTLRALLEEQNVAESLM